MARRQRLFVTVATVWLNQHFATTDAFSVVSFGPHSPCSHVRSYVEATANAARRSALWVAVDPMKSTQPGLDETVTISSVESDTKPSDKRHKKKRKRLPQLTERHDFVTSVGNKQISARRPHSPSSSRHRKDPDYPWLRAIGKVCNGSSNTKGSLDSKTLDLIPAAVAAWSRKGSVPSANEAQSLLQRVVEEFRVGNTNVTASVLNVKLFNSVMSAWERTRMDDAPKKIQSLIQSMRRLSNGEEGTGTTSNIVESLKPNVVSFSILAKAYAKSRSPEAVEKATMILDFMERNDLNPNTHTYNAILLAHVHSNDLQKAIKVREIINRMSERASSQDDPECAPDIYSYQSLISAWSRTPLAGTAIKAEQILHFLDSVSENTRPDLKPNVHCYTAAIHAWSHSTNEPQKARRAYQILHHMRTKAGLQPTVVAYTAVLNACALPVQLEDKQETLSIAETSFQIARLVMEELRYDRHASPNFLTFATMLHVIATTTPSESSQREQMIRVTFDEACKAGQVGYIVLEKLQIAASDQLYHELLGSVMKEEEDEVAVSSEKNQGSQRRQLVVHLPLEWTRNVKGELNPGKRYVRDKNSNRRQDDGASKVVQVLKEIRKEDITYPYSKG